MYDRDQYKSSIEHAEDLRDPELGLDLDCIRSNIILKTSDGTLPMVPVFSNTYGMLVNKNLFEKEGLSVPTTYKELLEVCNSFRGKGYDNPLMGFSREETTSLILAHYETYIISIFREENIHTTRLITEQKIIILEDK
ncbi:MAG: extracellular solute-binding protein [Lachnospiraceae bacterium]|nr:extracellular solute-binding protein [Lachnospiraceae bacterium]